MSTILTNFNEPEFKEFLKSIIKEVLSEHVPTVASPDSDKPLNINEAAEFLDLEVTTLYEKTSKKLIPHFKKGNRLYFHRAELTDWIKKGKVKTNQDIEGAASTYLLNKSH